MGFIIMAWLPPKKTPIRLQVDPIECGATCLGIVLQFFGKNISPQELKKKLGISRNGSSAKSLVDAAKDYQLEASAARLSLSDLAKKNELAILFFDRCHFVVFEGEFNGRYFINDPFCGRYYLPIDQFKKRFSGVAIFLRPSQAFTKTEPLEQRRAPQFFLGASIIILGLFFSTAFFYLSVLLGKALVANRENSNSLFLTAAILVPSVIFWVIAQKISAWLRETERKESATKTKYWLEKCQALPVSFFGERPFYHFEKLIIGPKDLGREPLSRESMTVFLVSFSVALSFWVAAISVQVFLLVSTAAAAFWVYQKIIRYYILFDDSYPRLAANFAQDQYGIFEQTLQLSAMGQEQMLKEKFAEDQLAHAWQNRYSHQDYGRSAAVGYGILAISLLLVSVIASAQLASGALAFDQIVSLFILLCGLSLAHNRLFDLDEENLLDLRAKSIGQEIETYSAKNKISIKPRTGSTVFALHDLTFSYPEQNLPLFKNLSLEIKESQLLGITGKDNSGKSSLARIIAGDISPDNCKLVHYTNNGQPLKVAFIDNRSKLFEGTLIENIRLFDQSIDEQTIYQALQLSLATDVFIKKSLGLARLIHGHGYNLSAGEKKKVLLAQALVMVPDILVLDGFFESLDGESVSGIINNLLSIKQTTVVSSTDQAVLSSCHHICRLGE